MKLTKSIGQTVATQADRFTGDVYIDGIRNPDEQSNVFCAHVRFAPGARTAWHHHPLGQTSTSPTASATSPAGAAMAAQRYRRSAPATWPTSSRARSTG